MTTEETEAVVVPRTDTSIATDKNTILTGVTADTSTDSMKAVHSDDEGSIDDFINVLDDASNDVPDFTPPLRIHATRVPERLSGVTSLEIPTKLANAMKAANHRKTLSGSATSGSRSPMNPFDGGSSISSLEDAGFDTDILTDKMGTLELDASSSKLDNSSSNGVHLQTVAERLSEETMEDVHAFTNISSVSRGNSITTGGEVSSNVLEPLDECDDEDDNEEESSRAFKITNMEDIQEDAEER